MFKAIAFLALFFTTALSQRGFVPLVTPPCAFFTGGAYGAGDRIPLPTNWAKPAHTFTPGVVNHGNGMFTQVHGNGKAVQWISMPGQYGPAVCTNVGGCGSSLY